MYNFHKNKNEGGYHEYKHPSFRKDCIDDLKNIKRKLTINYKVGKSITKKKYNGGADYEDLKHKWRRSQSFLEKLEQQNKVLIKLNQKLIKKYKRNRNKNTLLLSKMLFIFANNINNKNIQNNIIDDFDLNRIKDLISKLQTSIDRSNSQSTMYKDDQDSYDENTTYRQLNELVNLFYKTTLAKKVSKIPTNNDTLEASATNSPNLLNSIQQKQQTGINDIEDSLSNELDYESLENELENSLNDKICSKMLESSESNSDDYDLSQSDMETQFDGLGMFDCSIDDYFMDE